MRIVRVAHHDRVAATWANAIMRGEEARKRILIADEANQHGWKN
jgi:hypothetical protein